MTFFSRYVLIGVLGFGMRLETQNKDGSLVTVSLRAIPPQLSLEEKQQQFFYSSLEAVEAVAEKYKKDDGSFVDENLYRLSLKKDIRRMREIFDLYKPQMSRILHFPQLGESTECLRAKREEHFAAATMILRDYADNQLQIHSEAKAMEAAPPSFDLNKPVLIGGLFTICAIIAARSFYENDAPSLPWMLLLCGMWSAGIWLWGSFRRRLSSQHHRSHPYCEAAMNPNPHTATSAPVQKPWAEKLSFVVWLCCGAAFLAAILGQAFGMSKGDGGKLLYVTFGLGILASLISPSQRKHLKHWLKEGGTQ